MAGERCEKRDGKYQYADIKKRKNIRKVVQAMQDVGEFCRFLRKNLIIMIEKYN